MFPLPDLNHSTLCRHRGRMFSRPRISMCATVTVTAAVASSTIGRPLGRDMGKFRKNLEAVYLGGILWMFMLCSILHLTLVHILCMLLTGRLNDVYSNNPVLPKEPKRGYRDAGREPRPGNSLCGGRKHYMGKTQWETTNGENIPTRP
jgi:hypothetical protein